ncbi:Alpha/Beta hydrolase protein [Haematococcus lacustris]
MHVLLRCAVLVAFLLALALILAPSNNTRVRNDGTQPAEPDWFQPMAVLLPAGSGYKLTEHFATTLDGYILRIFRLQHPSSQAAALAPGNSSTPARLMPRPVALLQHALLDSSAGWLLQGPGNSLACSLALEGWDVWLGNVRGNRFSRNHTHLSAADQEFWAYSWDHHAALDLPAMVDLALAVSGAPSLQYVGYSQGTTMLLAALSAQPSLGHRLSVAVLLAPVAMVGHITSAPFATMANLGTAELLTRYGLTEFGAHNAEYAQYTARFCSSFPWLCIKWLQLLCGANPDGNIQRELLPTIMHYLPAGTSIQNMAHWGQSVRRGGSGAQAMQMFDYGTLCPNSSQARAAARSAALAGGRRYRAGGPSLHGVQVLGRGLERLAGWTWQAWLSPQPNSGLNDSSGGDGRSWKDGGVGGAQGGSSSSGSNSGGTSGDSWMAGGGGGRHAGWLRWMRRRSRPAAQQQQQQQAGLWGQPPGLSCNQWEYGQEEPPRYDLTRINTPVALFTGGRDSLSDFDDVSLLVEALPEQMLIAHVHLPHYAHLDFGLGSDTRQHLIPQVLQVMQESLRA